MESLSYVIKEMISTEKSYNKYLKILNDFYFEAIRKVDSRNDNFNKFCDNFKPIIELHDSILTALLSIDIENHSIEETVELVTDSLFSYSQGFKFYRPYLQQYDSINQKMHELSRKRAFRRIFLEGIKDRNCDGLDYASLLIMPVQRLPRYMLLLKELLKGVKPSDQNITLRAHLQSVLASINELITECNNSIDQFATQAQLYTIYEKWGCKQEILKPSRIVVLEGDLKKKMKQKYHFILFDDSLMYGSPTNANSYKFHNLIDLSTARINELNTSKYPLSFQFVSTNKTFVMAANNEDDLKQWVDTLRATIKKCKNPNVPVNIEYSKDTTDSFCMNEKCEKEFKMFQTRYSCKYCGRIFCETCLNGVSVDQFKCLYCENQKETDSGEEQDPNDSSPSPNPSRNSMLIGSFSSIGAFKSLSDQTELKSDFISLDTPSDEAETPTIPEKPIEEDIPKDDVPSKDHVTPKEEESINEEKKTLKETESVNEEKKTPKETEIPQEENITELEIPKVESLKQPKKLSILLSAFINFAATIKSIQHNRSYQLLFILFLILIIFTQSIKLFCLVTVLLYVHEIYMIFRTKPKIY